MADGVYHIVVGAARLVWGPTDDTPQTINRNNFVSHSTYIVDIPFMIIGVIPVMLNSPIIYDPDLPILAAVESTIRADWGQSSDFLIATWLYIYGVGVISDVHEAKVLFVSDTDDIFVEGR